MTGGSGRILRVGDVLVIRRSRLTCGPDHSIGTASVRWFNKARPENGSMSIAVTVQCSADNVEIALLTQFRSPTMAVDSRVQ
jgi:hypothetical protein